MHTGPVTDPADVAILAAVAMLGDWARADVIAGVADIPLDEAGRRLAKLETAGWVTGVAGATFTSTQSAESTARLPQSTTAVMHLRAA
ncbi:MAG: hypothetical protein ACYC0H_11895, partial [Solirubrobacteraceae bacterium]